ncbi:MAG TPA: ABC transporter permease, partial [Myxococcota bacterium]
MSTDLVSAPSLSSSSSLAALLFDNPIVTKDAAVALRRPRAAIVWVLGLIAFATGAALVVAERTSSIYNWQGLDPLGDDLLVIVVAVALVGISTLVPALASSSIAGEREQGTLPLLLVTGMTPLQIVVGKLLGVLVTVAPFIALVLPALALTTLARGVAVVDVAAITIGIVAYAVAAAAVGILASAVSSRARVAAPMALVGVGLPALLCALPVGVDAGVIVDGQPALHQLVFGGLVGAAVVTVVAIYGAWSSLAPRATPRRVVGTKVFVALSLVAPALLATIANAGTGRNHEQLAIGFFFATVIALAVVFHGYVAGLACDREASSPLRFVPFALVISGVGVAIAATALPPVELDHATRTDELKAIVGVAQLLATSMIAFML